MSDGINDAHNGRNTGVPVVQYTPTKRLVPRLPKQETNQEARCSICNELLNENESVICDKCIPF